MDHLSTRRVFLSRGLTMLAAAGTVPAFLDKTVMALAAPDALRQNQESGKDGKILVVIQLSGGNDGLNTVVPYADDAYQRARPALAKRAADVLRINDHIGLNSQLTPLKDMYDNGQLCIIQGVGYPNPNRSHFRSMDIWHSADPKEEQPTSGWLGRFFDNTCDGADPHVGVSMGENLPLAMQGDRITPLSFERAEAYRYQGRDRSAYLELNKPAAGPATRPAEPSPQIVRPGGRKDTIEVSPASELDFLTRTAMDAQVSSEKVARIMQRRADVNYPNGEFGQSLRTIASMIAGEMPTRVYYASLGGFDTHANQSGRHDQLMGQFAAGVKAFWDDLKIQENDGRVLIMTFSEFGRRVDQNASGGTDHGAAAPMFLMGKSLKTGLAGKHPSLTNLDQGDLRYNVDFRQVYATVLENWLDTPSRPILGQPFNPLPIVKG